MVKQRKPWSARRLLHGNVGARRARRDPSPLRMVLEYERLEPRLLLTAEALPVPSLVIDPELYDPTSILVRFRDPALGEDTAVFGQGLSLPGTSVGRRVSSGGGLYRVNLSSDVDVASALAAYSANPEVLYAEPNYQIRLAATPNDPQFNALWGLNNTGQTGGTDDTDIDAPEAWDISVGSGTTIVAVIDTGVDYLHEDLAANIWVNPGETPGDGIDNDGNGFVDDVHGYDFFNDDGDPMDDHNHGTHVAGTIGGVGNNGVGVTGVNWNVKIMGVKFLDASGSGTIASAAEAIDYAVANGATISNNSWGYNGGFSQALYDSIKSARDAGHIFVAAAGNGNAFGVGQNNDQVPFWPSSFDLENILAVAAVDHNDGKASFSNFGATTVDVAAPGVGILSTTRGNTYSTFNGTSMATPHAAGLVALLRDQHPEWSFTQVIDRVVSSVDKIAAMDGTSLSGGRINAHSALLPDTSGPMVVSNSPQGVLDGTVSSMRFAFSEGIDPSSFGVEDITSFTGPNGSISVSAVSAVAGTLSRQFDIFFAAQTSYGDYLLTLGPEILDLSGNQMNQDGDQIDGEPTEDQFLASFTLVPYLGHFDFGPTYSPVAAGYDRVSYNSSYNSTQGFGWLPGTSVGDVDRGVGTLVTRDLIYGSQMTFAADVPNGTYDVTIQMGDLGPYAHDQMQVLLEGTQVAVVSSLAGEVLTLDFTNIGVADGQLTLRLVDQGGSDANAVINGLEVVWVGPDNSGPRVIDASPAGNGLGPIDRFTLDFSEPIQDGSFTEDDVTSLVGPGGNISGFSVNKLSDTQYEVAFPPQTAEGTYSLTIGPDILDANGNAMDQDGDGTAGETVDDQFTTSFSVVPFEPARFDFGTSFSPLEPGYQRVAPNTAYTSAQGYGWLNTSAFGIDRGGGTAVTRDLSYASQLTFAVDVPNGTYDVTVQMGDLGPYAHDLIGVLLEGSQVDTVSSPAGQVLTLSYTNISVADSQLTLRLVDQGGSDVNAVINGLEVIWVGADNSGPKVIDASPAGNGLGPIDHFTLDFSEPIQDGSFTAADVASLVGPAGDISGFTVNKLSDTQYEVAFPAQSAAGSYSLTVGPDILDANGNAMDQDGDGIAGESLDDQFTASFSVVPFEPARFDFGTSFSPLEAGYQRVAPNTVYSPAQGYGWLNTSAYGIDRGGGTAVTRDLNYGNQLTFAVDVPNGTYDVTIQLGDLGPYAHDLIGVLLEGIQVATVTSPAGQVLTLDYANVSVADGQLTLRLADQGGNDPNAVINGLEVVWVGPDSSGPRVVDASPAGNGLGPIDHFTLDFSEPIQDGSFTEADVASLVGPAGNISGFSVNKLSDTQYEVAFPAQSAEGTYSLTIGPDILDANGNAMDQDGDGISGETVADQFTTSFSVVPFEPARFDFGTSFSPLEPGYQRVAPNTAYTSAQGYGWLNTSAFGIDRGGGTAVTRDLNYGNQLTFVVDVPNGTYDVTLQMGDLGPYAHDLIGVLLEGNQVATVTSPAGQVLTLSYTNISVADGQLTLRLADQGGSDVNAVINGLEVAWAGGSPAGSAAQSGLRHSSTGTPAGSPQTLAAYRAQLQSIAPPGARVATTFDSPDIVFQASAELDSAIDLIAAEAAQEGESASRTLRSPDPHVAVIDDALLELLRFDL